MHLEKKKKEGQRGKKDVGRGVSQGQARYGRLVKRSGLISGIKEKVLVPLLLARNFPSLSHRHRAFYGIKRKGKGKSLHS